VRSREGQRSVNISTVPSRSLQTRRLLWIAAIGSWIAFSECESRSQEKTRMDGNYIFLCGVMWCRFGQQDAGKELLRAADSTDPDIQALAWAMLAKSGRRLKVYSSTTAFS